MPKPRMTMDQRVLTDAERRCYWAGYERGYRVGSDRHAADRTEDRLRQRIAELETKLQRCK